MPCDCKEKTKIKKIIKDNGGELKENKPKNKMCFYLTKIFTLLFIIIFLPMLFIIATTKKQTKFEKFLLKKHK